ncbi:MAG: UDP-N-acetylglucosamine 1-carboxyvinyltransferase [Candidatus Marinimicrobia bacterium]|nr:UDP-N-acetylglucosamine 1-carboxyvinyltransferase [Candidatus Neomarinimicrobiota bacterium]MCH8068214.1 UDP-N-acetylglucosamine 1-carboxyvinyltransferase [Candidatus Neomarinimicrobiota bacterium]
MDKIIIIGGKRLSGKVTVGGAKNAVLPVMAATLLSPDTYHITRVPDLRDTRTMIRLLKIIGAEVSFENNVLIVDTRKCDHPEAPYGLVKTMRASFYVLGPLLSRFGYAKVSLPGGCAWGPRPVNFHVDAMRILGAEVNLEEGYIIAKSKQLNGSQIKFEVSSVGATGNALMAAVKAKGVTVIENAAREPEITCLCEFLNKMGANISGIGTHRLTVQGVEELHGIKFEVIPDRIEAATFLIAGAMIGDEIDIRGINVSHLEIVLDKLRDSGCQIMEQKDQVTISGGEIILPRSIKTGVYPGFPTDLQAQWMALMALAKGTSLITDTIYHDRFTHIAELNRLGAKITLDQNTATVTGQSKLKGAPVMSTDIRASASLILAALAAKGRTDISRVYHIDRGYEKIEEKFKRLGADIWREKE